MSNTLMYIFVVALAVLAGAVWAIVALARQVRSQQRELDQADQQLAAKDQRIERLVQERALLEGHREVMQHAITHYITSLPKANKTHARRLAAERCMN